MSLAAYRLATRAAGPLVGFYLRRRLARGKEDPARFRERFGEAGRTRPDGRLVWVHAASVGEALSVLPLVERLRLAPAGPHVLLTTGTVTSARLMAERLPAGAFHQFVPVDRPDAVARFLAHWRPDLALWVESELWPNLVVEARRRGTPMVLVNGRMSETSFRRWQRLSGMAAALLGCFALCLAQTPADAERFVRLGAPAVRCVGNLKQAAAPLPADPAAFKLLMQAMAGRPRWLAASTHRGEEAAAGRVHKALAVRFPRLLTVAVPRHPERGPEAAEALAAMGLAVARRAAGELPGPATDAYVADTLGELGLFYRLGAPVLLGGSLVPHGGQNPLEPARLGNALLFGPHMANFAEIAGALLEAGAAESVADEPALAAALAALLADPAEAGRRGEAALAVAATGGGVLDAVLGQLAPWLGDAGAAA